MDDLRSRLVFSIETAIMAGNLLMKNFGKQNEPQWTAESDESNFKIVMDKKSDDLIRARIKEHYPNEDIYSEEGDDLVQGGKLKWVFDPLDGTVVYTNHTSNNWSDAISFIENATPQIGVVYLPERKELYQGMINAGAFCNGIPIHVSNDTVFKKLSVCMGGGKSIRDWFNKSSMKILREGLESIGSLYSFGCASAPLCQVASGIPDSRLPTVGRFDAYIGGSAEPFDVAAEVNIIREAGGKVTHLSGKDWVFSPLYKGDPTVIAANPELHEKILFHLGSEIDRFYDANGFGKYR